MSALRQLLDTNTSQKLTLLHAWLLVPVALLALRMCPFNQLLQWIERRPGNPPTNASDLAKLRDIGRLVNAATARSPWTCTCLPRSLILHHLLRRRGLKSDLKIGVSRADGQFVAHAWVECLGVPLNDQPDIAAHYMHFHDLP